MLKVAGEELDSLELESLLEPTAPIRYVLNNEETGEISEVATTSKAKLAKLASISAAGTSPVTTGVVKPIKPAPPGLRETQAIMRQAIFARTGGLNGLIDTLEDARCKSTLPDGSFDHRVRLKAAEMELRMMGLMGSEANAAVEEAKSDTVIPQATAELKGDAAITDFMRRVRAAQTGEDPEHVKLEVDLEALRKLSPASVGEKAEKVSLLLHKAEV